MTAQEFIHGLGFWSSHPYWLRQKETKFRRWAWLPLIILLCFGFFLALELENWAPMLEHATAWIVVLASTATAALGCTMTVTLCRRLAEYYRRHQGSNVDPGSEDFDFSLPVFIAFVILGAVGPFFFSQIEALPPLVRYGFHLFAVLPLVGIDLALGAPDERKKGEVPRRRLWLLALAVLLLASSVATTVYDLGGAYNHPAWQEALAGVLGWYAALGCPFLGLLLFAPLTLAAFALWWLWPRYVLPPLPEAAAAGSRPGAPPAPPPWVEELLKGVPGCTRDKTEALLEGETSPKVQREDLRWFFGDVTPTESQAEAFDKFKDFYRRLIENYGAGRDDFSWLEADLLIDGDKGSGCTTALLACAAYAAFVRGQRVLFVVPDEAKACRAKERIGAFLRRIRLHYYVSCDVVRDDTCLSWLQPRAAVPHIMIGTVKTVERSLYGMICTGDQELRLRRLIHMLEVVLVDDFMEFDDTERSHLPFMLDKQRLLLDAEHLPLQVVVVFPKLARLGKVTLSRRFFTDKHADEAKRISFLPPPSGRTDGRRGWRVVLQSDDPQKTIEDLALRSLRLENPQLYVVLYEKGLAEEQRSQRLKRLIEQSKRDRVALISDLDQALDSPEKVDAVFYQVALHEDVCLALRSALGHAETVIFSVLHRDDLQRDVMPAGVRDALAGVVPVVTDRSARPLMISHVRSVLRHMRSHTPIFEDVWKQMGVNFEDRNTATCDPEGAPDVVLERDFLDEEAYRSQLARYVTLAHTRSGEARVIFGELPDEETDVFKQPGGQVFFIGKGRARQQAVSGGELLRRGVWREEGGQELKVEDLAHVREFKVARGAKGSCVPEDLRVEEDRVVLTTQPWLGGGDDAYLPVFDIDWEVLSGYRGSTLDGGPHVAFRRFRLEPEDARFTTVRVHLTHLMNEYGEASQRETVTIAYRARLSCVVLGPKELEQASLSRQLGELLAGAWNTADSSGFWPDLTAAINYALEERLPGLLYHARALAFQLTGPRKACGEAIVWLIEPWSSGDTVMDVLGQVVKDSAERGRLFGFVQAVLERIAETSLPKQQAMRRFGRVGYNSDERALDTDYALKLVGEVLQHAQARRPDDLGPLLPGGQKGREKAPQPLSDAELRVPLPEKSRFMEFEGVTACDTPWGAALPEAPALESGEVFKWQWNGRPYELRWGFGSSADRDKYLGLLRNLKARIMTGAPAAFGYYIVNDPYLDSVRQMGEKLRELYGGDADQNMPEFLLAFIQSIPYKHDPKAPTDWPRFPSEYFANNGGDCEDSSIALMFFLTQFKYDAAYVEMHEHVAVGVAGRYQGHSYPLKDKPYYYAETAIDGGYQAIGVKRELAKAGTTHVNPLTELPRQGRVQVISVEPGADVALLRCTLVSQVQDGEGLRVVAYARRTDKPYDMGPAALPLGGVKLAPQSAASQAITFDIPLNTQNLSDGAYALDVIVFSQKELVGGWLGVASLVRSQRPAGT